MLNGLNMRDVGVAGFTGFDTMPPGGQQLRYILGGHAAALTMERLPAVANYIRTGAVPDGQPLLRNPSPWFETASNAAKYLPLLLGLAAGAALVYAVLAATLIPLIVLAGMLAVAYLGLQIA